MSEHIFWKDKAAVVGLLLGIIISVAIFCPSKVEIGKNTLTIRTSYFRKMEVFRTGESFYFFPVLEHMYSFPVVEKFNWMVGSYTEVDVPTKVFYKEPFMMRFHPDERTTGQQ